VEDSREDGGEPEFLRAFAVRLNAGLAGSLLAWLRELAQEYLECFRLKGRMDLSWF
jgi:hypothetical protein